jgi:hypothetical protein
MIVMKKYGLFLVLSLLTWLVNAEEVKPYEWEKDRARFVLTPSEQNQSEIILKYHQQFEYVFVDEAFVMFSTVHRIVLVNNSEAIQKNNRIVIPMNSTIELVDLKARAINKAGKAVYFDKSNLKELKEEESGNAYRIFAIEGVELGSEIEYFYTRKMEPILYERSYMQFDVQVKKGSFMLSSPKHLKFAFKSYNGLAEVKEEMNEERNIYAMSMGSVPAMKEEPFSFYHANRKRIEFKLAYNTGRSDARLYTWDDAAKRFYAVLTETSKDDDKALEKFVKTLNDNPADETTRRIQQLEQKIKTTIQVNNERREESLSQIESVLKYKLASREGITKLFLAVFAKQKIACQPVLTCSRENARFDGDFDSWGFLDDYILYFPDTKGFIAPYHFESRYPLVPADLTAQKGLFIEPFTVGDMKSALASIEDIPAIDYQLNTDNLDIDVTFSEDLTSAQIRQKREFGGYNATYFSPYYDVMTADQRKQMIEQLTKQTAPDANVTTWTAKPLPGKGAESFLIDTDFQSTHFLERAGPRVLFKVGELIGPQVEMYRDDTRTNGVENEYNRGYDRTIQIKIPEGYNFKNLADLNFDVTYKDKTETPFLFQSSYTMTGNILKVHILEYYKQIYAPLSRYEDYRKVINAAADFNKVTLVLEKAK